MRRKCRTVEGIAVMELDDVGVRTIAMAEAATEAVRNKRRRRFNDDDDEGEAAECKVTSSTTSYIQLRSRRILVDHHPRNENQCLSPRSDHDDDVSCCSNIIGSCGKRIIELPDLEFCRMRSLKLNQPRISAAETGEKRRRLSELRAEPEDMDSTSRPSGGNSRRRSMVEKMPTEAELEDFFVVAEEKLRNQFAEKYNYDILKDQPLEGRYEWARLKP